MKCMKKAAAAMSAAMITASAAAMPNVSAIERWEPRYIDSYFSEDGRWVYMVSDETEEYEKHICIIEYYGEEADVVIPAEIDGLPVKSLSACFYTQAFDPSYQDDPENAPRGLKSLVIPASVTDIDMPLRDYPTLKSIVFEGDEARFHSMSEFENTLIEEIELPKPLPDTYCYRGLSLANNPKLRKVAYKKLDDEFLISNSIFENCPQLCELVIPENCTKLTFGGNSCTNTGFTELDLTQDINLYPSAFSRCEKLRSVTFHGSTNIHSAAFGECHALSNVTFDQYPDLFPNAFNNCTSLENIDYPTDTQINGSGFSNCPNLRSINSEPVFDESTGDFYPKMKELVMLDFTTADNVGFINDYLNAKIKKFVAEEITPDMTDIEKLRVIHDWVCANTEYEPSAQHYKDLSNHVDSSVFLSGQSVCEGYARAMNLICHAAGLESCYVISSDHAWNIVKIGGHWLHTDSTWDDVNQNTDWFLHSDSELKAEGGSHKRWMLSCPSELHSFQTDTLPESDCPMGDVNTDSKVGAADLVTFSRYLLGAQDISADDIVLADLNFDGSYDCFDMVRLRKKAVSGS